VEDRKRINFAFEMGSVIRRGLTKRIDLNSLQKAMAFRQGDLDCLGGLYAIINACALVLAKSSTLTPDEAWRAMRLAIDNLADRRTAMETFTNPLVPRRAFGLAKMIGRFLSNRDGQLQAEQAPTSLNASIEQVFDWIETSLEKGMPVVVMLEGDVRRYTTISGIDRWRLYLLDGGNSQSIKRKDCGVRDGLHKLKATNMFRVKLVKLESTATR
jgi:hypothetical protein